MLNILNVLDWEMTHRPASLDWNMTHWSSSLNWLISLRVGWTNWLAIINWLIERTILIIVSTSNRWTLTDVASSG